MYIQVNQLISCLFAEATQEFNPKLYSEKNFIYAANTLFINFIFLDFYKNESIMIKLQVIGNLGKDAIVNNVNGKSVINFTVAHTEKFKDAQGNLKDKTTWVDCAYWTDRTAVAPYLKKGTQVYAEGQPDVRTYTTQDGRSGATLSLRVLSVQLLGAKSSDGGGSSSNAGGNNYQSQPAYSQPATAAPSANDLTEPLDDLPF